MPPKTKQKTKAAPKAKGKKPHKARKKAARKHITTGAAVRKAKREPYKQTKKRASRKGIKLGARPTSTKKSALQAFIAQQRAEKIAFKNAQTPPTVAKKVADTTPTPTKRVTYTLRDREVALHYIEKNAKNGKTIDDCCAELADLPQYKTFTSHHVTNFRQQVAAIKLSREMDMKRECGDTVPPLIKAQLQRLAGAGLCFSVNTTLAYLQTMSNDIGIDPKYLTRFRVWKWMSDCNLRQYKLVVQLNEEDRKAALSRFQEELTFALTRFKVLGLSSIVSATNPKHTATDFSQLNAQQRAKLEGTVKQLHERALKDKTKCFKLVLSKLKTTKEAAEKSKKKPPPKRAQSAPKKAAKTEKVAVAPTPTRKLVYDDDEMDFVFQEADAPVKMLRPAEAVVTTTLPKGTTIKDVEKVGEVLARQYAPFADFTAGPRLDDESSGDDDNEEEDEEDEE